MLLLPATVPPKQMSLVSTSTSIQPKVPEPQGNGTDSSCTIKLRLLGLVAFPFELLSTSELDEAYWDTSISRSYSPTPG